MLKTQLNLKLNAKEIREFLQILDAANINFDDRLIDEMLGIPELLESDYGLYLDENYRNEQYVYEGTPYNLIREFIKTAKPERGQNVFDLGSGYGRVVIFGALLNNADYYGVELMRERVRVARAVKRNFKIKNAHFILGNVRDVDLSLGNIFFLFNPFSPETLRLVGEKLRRISGRKKIKIASWGGPSSDYLLDQEWLELVDHYIRPFEKIDLVFLESK